MEYVTYFMEDETSMENFAIQKPKLLSHLFVWKWYAGFEMEATPSEAAGGHQTVTALQSKAPAGITPAGPFLQVYLNT
jgi:hypothetical protein